MLKLLFLYSLSFSLTTSVIGDKYALSPSKSYHFSKSDLIEVHLNQTSSPFFIGIKEGAFNFVIGKNKHRHFILNEKQHHFFSKTSSLIKDSLMTWNMNDTVLTLNGPTMSDNLYSYLFKECKKANTSILLELKTPNPSSEAHPCLGFKKPKNKVQVHLMLINKTRIRNKSLGLGAPSSLPWTLTPEGQLGLNEISGEINASTAKGKNKGEMIFEGLLSIKSPLVFTNGLEVGIQTPGATLLTRGNIQWKNITSRISLDLKDFNKKQAIIDVDFKKMSRTSETNTFRTESFKRTNQLKLNKWVRLLNFIETTEGAQKRSPLAISVFGNRKKSKTIQEKELWIKLTPQEM